MESHAKYHLLAAAVPTDEDLDGGGPEVGPRLSFTHPSLVSYSHRLNAALGKL